MADTIAVINNGSTTTATVEEDFITTATSATTVTSTGGSVSDSTDTDVTTNGLTEGSILIYKTATSKWTAATELADQTITGGQY